MNNVGGMDTVGGMDNSGDHDGDALMHNNTLADILQVCVLCCRGCASAAALMHCHGVVDAVGIYHTVNIIYRILHV
jgi:hypothetical protein